MFGIRVVKTAIATLLAIALGEQLEVSSPLSSGLLAILGVDVTRKRSLQGVTDRFLASIFGLTLAWGLFYFLGFNIAALALYILIAFPLIAKTAFKEGINTSSVVVFHIFAQKDINFEIVCNEFLYLIIGLGSATLVNIVYMPRERQKILTLRQQINLLFSRIFLHVHYSLKDCTYVWNGQEILDANAKIKVGIFSATKEEENQLLRSEPSWLVYFMMRKQQLESIQRIVELVSLIHQSFEMCQLAAPLFKRLSEDVKMPQYIGDVERLLSEFEQKYKEMELPDTKEEFEGRAVLYQICRELRQFLLVSKKSKVQLKSLEKLINKRE